MQVQKVLGVIGFAAAVMSVIQYRVATQPKAPKLTTGREVNQLLVDRKRWDSVLGDACEMLSSRDAVVGPQTVALLMSRQVLATDKAIAEAVAEIVEVCDRPQGFVTAGVSAPPLAPAPDVAEVATNKIDPRVAHPEIYHGSLQPTLLKTFGTATAMKPQWKTIAAKDAANCRVMPSLDHEVKKAIAPGTRVLVNASVKGWYFNAIDLCWIGVGQF